MVIKFIPVLVGFGITAGLGTEILEIASSTVSHQLQPSCTSKINYTHWKAVFQTVRGLDQITADKGGLYLPKERMLF